MKQSGRILAGILTTFLIAGGFHMIWLERREVREGFDRQRLEERLADYYLDCLREPAASDAADEVKDGAWYEENGLTYTPDYASGYVQCILEVPSAGIKRPVFSGSWEEIAADLDIWMVVAARPDYKLGETHYVIYGHNHTEQNLSFNNLQPSVQLGDEFTLTDASGIRVYKVTGLYSITRSEAAILADDFSLPADQCYIATCGRGEHRYRDYIVEGTLVRVESIKENEADRVE